MILIFLGGVVEPKDIVWKRTRAIVQKPIQPVKLFIRGFSPPFWPGSAAVLPVDFSTNRQSAEVN
jgi:hypothetical protein